MNCLTCPPLRRALCLLPCTPEIAAAWERAHADQDERERQARYLPPVPKKEAPRPDFRGGKAPKVNRAHPVADRLR
jgi:hypothetical protein